MLELGPLAFGAPWLLLALASLPALWWLLRSVPPLPRRVKFPAIALLAKLRADEHEPAQTPLWLLLLRMALAALVIIALAEPLLNPHRVVGQSTPLLIALDDGWAAAADWPKRRDVVRALVDDAARLGQPVALLTTAARSGEPQLTFASPGDVRARIDAASPAPWTPDRKQAATRLQDAELGPKDRALRVVWLTDGLDDPGTDTFVAALKARGPLEILAPAPGAGALLVQETRVVPEGLAVRLTRADMRGPRTGIVRAQASDGRMLAETPFTLPAGGTTTEAVFALPRLVLNDAARIEVVGARSAGTTYLLDETSRRRSVGLVSGDAQNESQPLLSDVHYLQRALQPFADISGGSLDQVLAQNQSMIVLADVGRIVGPAYDGLVRWIEAGGTLVRFAGPRLAESADDLVPEPLRQHGRTLGGALSWDTPQGLAPFDETSPFAGLTPGNDVKVGRQVLAEPGPDLAQKTWARLADGTPLVTAAPRGKGLVVLFHVTANTSWSDLPLSGLYVDMLKRLLALSHAPHSADQQARNANGQPLQPQATLDGFGTLGAPGSEAVALPPGAWQTLGTSAAHPPGLYGSAAQTVAFNLGRPNMSLTPLALPSGTRSLDTAFDTRTRSLKPALLAVAAGLALVDMLAVLIVSGVAAAFLNRRAAAAIVIALAVPLMLPHDACAEDADSFALKGALDFHLAYVKTGNPQVDARSQAGLDGLGHTLQARTAVEPAAPLGVDLETDELAFFPLLYWQVTTDQPNLSEKAEARLDSYMKHGGTLVIDTADADMAFSGEGPNAVHLRQILSRLDLPPLEPVPPDHVLTKAFYLVKSFPGRFANGRVWVEKAENGSDHDGVATLILGSNDWASAWARDEDGRPMAPLEGGEDQREMAMRFGVNLVMYALTGNYKADQVHVPALLERLGQ